MKTGKAGNNRNSRKTRDLLLWSPNFEAKSKYARHEATPIACEASALTPEPTALIRA